MYCEYMKFLIQRKWSFKNKYTLLLVGIFFLLPAVSSAATGEVQFSILPAYQFGTAGSYLSNGNTIAKLFDASTTSWWDAPSANGGYAGLDLTVPAKVTRMHIAPRPGYTVRMYGLSLQGSNVSSSTGPWTTITTLPSSFPPLYLQKQYNDIPVDTAGQYYRYYRILPASNSNYGGIAELRLIGVASSSTPYIPVAPNISPAGGRYAVPIQVTLTSSTTDAAVYYTTDGTTPAFSGGVPQGTTQLYSSPITISSTTATTTVKSIAVSGGTYVSDVSDPAYFSINSNFTPGQDWYDTNGKLVESHNGGITYANGRYYWYGETFNSSTNANEIETLGVTAYSSADLLNWKYEGLVFSQAGAYMLRKPHVIYNATTSQYVMWARNNTNGKAIVATSSSPTGNFSLVTSTLDPDSYGVTDVYLYKDTDGSAYVAYTSNDTTKIIISKLSSNYLTTIGSPIIAVNNANRNSPVLFKRGSVYFLMTTGQSNFTATMNKYSTSTSLTTNTWSVAVNPFQVSGSEDYLVGYHSLVTDVIPVQGRTDGYLFMGDRFDGSNTTNGSLYNSRHVWLPITFPTNNTMSVAWSSSWNLDSAFTSTASPANVSSFSSDKVGLQVNLTWSNNETSGYLLYLDRATDSGFTQNLFSISLDPSTTSYSDTNIVNGTIYFYRLRIVNASGSTSSGTAIGNFSLASDTTPPTATVTVPASGALIRGSSVTLTATSSDNISVSSVSFYIDDVQVGLAGSSSPYSITWNSNTIADGSHSVVAVAVDPSGNVGTSTPVSFTVNNSQVAITADVSTVLQNSVGNTILITGNATTWATGTSPFSVSGSGSPSITSQTVISTSSASIVLSAGSVAENITLTDTTTSATTSVTVLPDTVAPSVTITVPTASSTLTGASVTLTATSTDNVGVASVQFALDGASIGASGTSSPYSISWNSTAASDGSHTLTAIAVDAAGNVATSSSVNVTVNNSSVPTVVTGSSTSLTAYGTILSATTTVSGGASSTIRGFVYGLTTTYTATSSSSGSFGVGVFSQTLSGLSCDTDYHYKAFSTNLAGTGLGTDKVFHTSICPTPGATGEVQYNSAPAYQFGTFGSYLNNGNTYAKLFDNDVTTWWDSNTVSGAVAGIDLRSPAVLTHIKIAPRKGYTVRLYGVTVQGATTSSSTGPWTNLYTIPTFPPFTPPYYPQGFLSDIAIDTGGTAYRYYRIVAADNTNANIAELKLIGTPGANTPYVPVAPVVSPSSGRFYNPTKVSITSSTTNAAIYYTTDNSTPTFSGGAPQGTTQLYTGPFTVGTTTGTTTVKSIAVSESAYVSDMSEPAIFSLDRNIYPAQDILDVKGRWVESHDGGILFANGKYYWYGQIFNANDPEIEKVGVSVYSSNDLINWTDEGAAVYTGRQYSIERPHVMYNDSTQKYVMWGHVVNYPNSTAVVAYSSTPVGPFTVATTTYNVDGMGLNDINLFKDNDGTGYVLYSNASNLQFVISRLSSDYLTTSGTYITPALLAGRESPSIFYRNGVYFLLTSGQSNWAPNMNKYSTSTSVMGTWSPMINPFQPDAEEDYTTAFSTQTTNVLQINGRNDSYIYMGDRNIGTSVAAGSLYYSKHIWLPITFPTNNTMTISWQSSWDLNTAYPTSNGPQAATSLSVNKSGNQVSLSWNNQETVGYDLYVERATDQSISQNVVSVPLNTGITSFTDTYGIDSGTNYYYRIKTVNGAGETNSTVVSTTVDVPQSFPVISSIATSTTQTSATLTWTTDQAASSTVNYGTTTSYGSASTTDDLVTSHSIVLTGLTPSTTYHFQVGGSNSVGGNSTSTDQTFTTSDLSTPPDTTPPSVPTNFTATSSGSTVHLSWINPVELDFSTVSVLGNDADYLTNPINGGAVVTGLAGTTWDITNVPDGTYYYSIFAYDSTGNISDMATSTIVVDTSVPPDTSAPTISGIATSTTSTGATIAWTTNQSSNSTVEYGVSTSYGSVSTSTSLVTEHSIVLAGLVSCTTYQYRISSENVSNISSNSSGHFTTTGCTSNAPVVSSVSDTVSVLEGKVISNAQQVAADNSINLFTINVPVGFSSTTNSSVFQIENLDSVTFFNTVSTSTIPESNVQVGSSVVHLTSYVDNGTPLVVFDNPITVTMSYSTQDVQGIDENSLKIYRYDGGIWNELSNCVVDKNAHTVTCQTSHFSDFSIFGQIEQVVTPPQTNPVVSSSGTGSYSSGGNITIIYPNRGTTTATSSVRVVSNATSTFQTVISKVISTKNYVFTKDLHYKDVNTDVLYLQKYLNTHGFVIAKSGVGSPGNENQRFGPATQKALIKFQKSKGIKPAVGTFGPITRKYVNGN